MMFFLSCIRFVHLLYFQKFNAVGSFEQLLRTVGVSSMLRKRLDIDKGVSRMDLVKKTKKMMTTVPVWIPGSESGTGSGAQSQAPVVFGSVDTSSPGSRDPLMLKESKAKAMSSSYGHHGHHGYGSASSVAGGSVGGYGHPLSSMSNAGGFYHYQNKPFGEGVVDELLNSNWLVEELMLETRVARLSVETKKRRRESSGGSGTSDSGHGTLPEMADGGMQQQKISKAS
jgi:hypothetical protein